ncbi:MAG: nuclear transport factor 2 family protein [Alphaproteobacteria bacterium]|nr:nuclear transport factor 2 family protein [Alphaproteobacteria bacterium]
MRSIAVAISLVFLVVGTALFEAKAGDAETIAAINASSNALDDAFSKGDDDTIKKLMTPDHITVTPYYDGPQTVQDQLDSLKDLDWSQTIVGDVDVSLLGPDAALRTFVADLKGTFEGKTLPGRVFVTEVLVKQDGQWIERFYQVTTLE